LSINLRLPNKERYNKNTGCCTYLNPKGFWCSSLLLYFQKI
jgi:hypothetical protein